ncbi:MAG: YybS family protein [Nitrospinota bacterium]|nr:YybS family protein [Nitrospinota bacterium]
MVDRIQARDVLIPYGIFLVIVLVAFVAPPLGMIVGMLTPVPLILVYLQRGKITGLITITGVGLALLLLVGPQLAIAFIAAYGIMAAAMAETTRLSFSFEKIILISSLVPAVLTLLLLFVGLAGEDGSSLKGLENTLRKEAESYIQILEKSGETPENLKAIRKSVEDALPKAARVFPSFILISTLVGAVINFLTVRYLWLKFYSREYFEGMDVSRWMLPDIIVWVFIAAIGSMFYGPEISQVAGLNLAIILFFLYFLQGLSVVTHILKSKAFPKWVWIIVFILIPLNPMFFGLVVGMGLFDIWVDFRKIRVASPPDSMNSME